MTETADWTGMSKSEAVKAAMLEAGGGEPVSAKQVEAVLVAHGRADTNITQAMSALKAKGQASNPSKGMWLLEAGVEMGEGKARATRSPVVEQTKDKSKILCNMPCHFPLRADEVDEDGNWEWKPRDYDECEYSHDRGTLERERARERAGEGVED